MGLLSSASNWLRQAFGGRSLYLSNVMGEPPRRGTQQFLEVYDTQPWVRGVTGKVAQEVGATDWFAVDGRTGDPVPGHIMARSLKAPNPLMSGQALFRFSQLCLDLTGTFFWLIQRNRMGAPVAFWPVPPHWVTQTPTPAEPTFEIHWMAWMNFQATVPEDMVLWVNDGSPVNPYLRGSGIVRALSDEVETDEYAAKHAKGLFFNRAMPDLVIMADQQTQQPELETLERRWRQRLQGLYRAMSPYFTNRKLEFWQPQTMNLENLTLVPLRKFERDIYLQAVGMPPEQMGIVENSNRATIEASDFVFHSRLIKPRRVFLREELTMRLASLYDPNLQLGFVDTTPRDKEFMLSVAKSAPFSITVDEWRELQGRPPLPNGEGQVFVVPLQYYLTGKLSSGNDGRPESSGGAAAAAMLSDMLREERSGA